MAYGRSVGRGRWRWWGRCRCSRGRGTSLPLQELNNEGLVLLNKLIGESLFFEEVPEVLLPVGFVCLQLSEL